MKIKRHKTFWGATYEETEVSHHADLPNHSKGHSIQQDLEPAELKPICPCFYCATLQEMTNDNNVKCCLHAWQAKQKGVQNESRNS